MAFQKRAAAKDSVIINPPKFERVRVPIMGTSFYVSNNFSQESDDQMKADQERGQVDKPSRAKKPPKDFEAGFRGSLHVSDEGWCGIPVIAFRSAMVRAAQLVGIEMTKAKMCVFVECDGYDQRGDGIVKIEDKPTRSDKPVRNSNGSIDIRARGRFPVGWRACVTVKYDAEFMSKSSVVNLLERAGICVGVGAGRPFSTNSVGQGWGTFRVVADDDRAVAAE